MMFGAMTSTGVPTFVKEPVPVVETNASLVAEKTSKSKAAENAPSQEQPKNSVNMEEEVRQFFKEAPILAEISFCESTFRHTDSQGAVLRGVVNNRDVGLMQINERFHAEQAEKLGHDLHTPEGNMAYALWLYERQGVRPWSASAPCWSKHTTKELALK